MKLFGFLTSRTEPPRPGTPQFAAWSRLTQLNVALYRVSGGRIGGSFDGAPALLLHHVGRKSGEKRVTPLLYLPENDPVIVASMGGTPKHPAWFHNLRDAPETRIELGREKRDVRADVATAAERERLWPKLVGMYPAFAKYQEKTDREIPVVILRRR